MLIRAKNCLPRRNMCDADRQTERHRQTDTRTHTHILALIHNHTHAYAHILTHAHIHTRAPLVPTHQIQLVQALVQLVGGARTRYHYRMLIGSHLVKQCSVINVYGIVSGWTTDHQAVLRLPCSWPAQHHNRYTVSHVHKQNSHSLSACQGQDWRGLQRTYDE